MVKLAVDHRIIELERPEMCSAQDGAFGNINPGEVALAPSCCFEGVASGGIDVFVAPVLTTSNPLGVPCVAFL